MINPTDLQFKRTKCLLPSIFATLALMVQGRLIISFNPKTGVAFAEEFEGKPAIEPETMQKTTPIGVKEIFEAGFIDVFGAPTLEGRGFVHRILTV